ncbi:MAG: glycosyltransferase family 4 protein [Acidobacteria bacterium]|nr:glycosyltransferase family 4 protein [Acidobacteriota bacterium]
MRPGVLLVTGAYYPELSGAGLQTRSLITRLCDQVRFTVLTTTADRSLPSADRRDGIEVHRVFVDPRSRWSKVVGAVRFTLRYLRLSSRFSVVHLVGFSQKSILFVVLARLSRKKIAIKLTSFGHDDPISMRRRGGVAAACYRSADLYLAVSPAFAPAYEAEALPRDRFRLMPNGVDIERFRPATADERGAVRRSMEISATSFVVLFVGFFSREKRPDVLFDAWARLAIEPGADSVLVFVGATRSAYHEVDQYLADEIRARATASGVANRLRFVEETRHIEAFHRMADVFVLPSVREGMSNALLEAMACGVPSIATRIEGVTDVVIEDGVTGLLVPPDDVEALERGLQRIALDRPWAARLGQEARRAVETRFSLEQSAQRHLDAYRCLAGTA